MCFHFFKIFATRTRQHQLAVLHATQTQHPVRHLTDSFAEPLHEDYLQAVVMIQMNMSVCKHHAVGVVLRLGKPLRQIRQVMVIYKV